VLVLSSFILNIFIKEMKHIRHVVQLHLFFFDWEDISEFVIASKCHSVDFLKHKQ